MHCADIIFFFFLGGLNLIRGQLCSETSEVSSSILSPSYYDVMQAVAGGCQENSLVGDAIAIECPMEYSVLFDNVYGPSQDVKFIWKKFRHQVYVWTKESYIIFDFQNTNEAISAIDLSLLIFDKRGMGVPVFELYSTSTITKTPHDVQNEKVPYDFLNNEDLGNFDQRMKNITLLLRTPISTQYLLMRWTFTGTSLTGVAISEVTFCVDDQPLNQPQPIQFQTPIEEITIFAPGVQKFWRNPFIIILDCSVSNAGSFTWNWTLNITQPVPNHWIHLMEHSNATRSSRLILNSTWFLFNRIIVCHVTTDLQTNITGIRKFHLFPLTINVTVEKKQRPITLSCEVYGYAGTFMWPTIWFVDGDEASHDEYTITERTGPNILILWVGHTRSSTIVTIEIPEFREGLYSCHRGSMQSEPILVLPSPSPTLPSGPPTLPSSTTIPATTLTASTNETTLSILFFAVSITEEQGTSTATYLISVAVSTIASSIVLAVILVTFFCANKRKMLIQVYEPNMLVPMSSNSSNELTADASTQILR